MMRGQLRDGVGAKNEGLSRALEQLAQEARIVRDAPGRGVRNHAALPFLSRERERRNRTTRLPARTKPPANKSRSCAAARAV